jgi:hypothetical protein
VLLRFHPVVPSDVTVLEAYVLIDRVEGYEADPVPVVLHAEHMVSAWTGTQVTWPGRPRTVDFGAPRSRAFPWGPPTVRLDVSSLVAEWVRRKAQDNLDIDLLASGRSPTGIALALEPGLNAYGPRLEIYVK